MIVIRRNAGQTSVKAAINAKSKGRRQQLRDQVALSSLSPDPGRNDISPELLLLERPIVELRPATRRVRKANTAHVAEVARSITKHGFCVPILITGDNRVVDGHVRIEAAKVCGLAAVPCIVIDHLSDEQIRVLTLGLNRLGEKGEWDAEQLQLELTELGDLGLDLTLTGFSDLEIDVLTQCSVLSDERDNDAPEVPAHATSMLGDLWRLGRHQLLCGDATIRDSYEQLLGYERAGMVFSDAPYNIPIAGFVSGLGKHKHENFAMGCGEMSAQQFQEFLAAYLSFGREFSEPGAVIFGCMDWRGSADIVLAAQEANLKLIQMITWDKGSGAMGSLYRNAFELVHVFCGAATPRCNNIELGRHGRDRTNVMHYPGANHPGSSTAEALKFHATPKPIELVEDLIIDVSRRGEIVLDPFMGSGTTIIAAERCNRRAYGIELEPKFVDVAVRRWQERTGQQAVHVSSGLTFEQLSRDRAEDSSKAGQGC